MKLSRLIADYLVYRRALGGRFISYGFVLLASKARIGWARRPRPTITPRYTDEDRNSNRHSSPLR